MCKRVRDDHQQHLRDDACSRFAAWQRSERRRKTLEILVVAAIAWSMLGAVIYFGI